MAARMTAALRIVGPRGAVLAGVVGAVVALVFMVFWFVPPRPIGEYVLAAIVGAAVCYEHRSGDAERPRRCLRAPARLSHGG